MPFLNISNTDISFGKKTLIWKIYTTNMTLTNTKQIQIIVPKEFVIAVLDIDSEILVMYMAIRN